MATSNYKQFIDGIGAALGFAETDASQAVQAISRTVLEYYQSELTRVLVEKCGLVVQSGPMAGMKLIKATGSSLFIPRLLGCYESELHPTIRKIVQRNHRRVVNVGCGEGYYAVGLARLMPGVQVYAFDTDEQARQATSALADLNGVADRVTVHGICDHQRLQELVKPGTLIVCDIEGGELDLIDPTKAPALADCDILVECHDFIQENLSEQITERFHATHDAALIANAGINPNEIPHVKSMRPLFKFLAVWEGRPGPTPWLFLQARSADDRHQRARAFAEKASHLLNLTQKAGDWERYEFLLEEQFHDMDRGRSNVPHWPCDLNLVPAPTIRRLVGPEGYRYFMYGLAEHFWLIRYAAGFCSDQRLLDMGCGLGKTALALKKLIQPPGSYTGFDIQPRLIEFAQTLFKQLRIDGHFKVDCFPIVSSSQYTGKAKGDGVPAEEFSFPYENDSFDCAVAFSVMTHLRSAAMENYAVNLQRVVRPGGKLLLSFYLLNNAPDRDTGGKPWSESPRRRALQPSPDSADGASLRVLKPDNPEYLVAYELDYLVDVFGRLGFQLDRNPLYGSWSGRSDFYGHQDYLLFRRKP